MLFPDTRFPGGPSVDRRETLPPDRKLAESKVQILGRAPTKKWGPKHAKFRSILYNLRFWSRISPERLKISKIRKLKVSRLIPCVLWKRSGELWSTNYRDLDVSLNRLKWTFSGDYISALKGCCALSFSTCVRDWPNLASAHPNGDKDPQKIQSWNSKFGLKFSVYAPIISRLCGLSLRNFSKTGTIFGRPAP